MKKNRVLRFHRFGISGTESRRYQVRTWSTFTKLTTNSPSIGRRQRSENSFSIPPLRPIGCRLGIASGTATKRAADAALTLSNL